MRKEMYRHVYTILKPYLAKELLWLIINISITLLNLLTPYIAMRIIDVSIVNKDFTSLYQNVLLLAGVTLLAEVLSIGQSLTATYIGEKLLYDLRMGLYRNISRKNILFFNNMQVGELTNRILGELPEIATLLFNTPLRIFTQILTFIITFAMLLHLNQYITLFIALLIPLLYILLRYYNPKFKAINTQIMEQYSKINNLLQENVSNIKILKYTGAYRYGEKRLSVALRQFIKIKYKSLYLNIQNNAFLSIIYNTPTIIIYLVGGYLVIKGHLTIGAMVAMFTYVSRLFAPISTLTNINIELQKSLVAFKRYYNFINDRDDLNNGTILMESLEKGIKIENISFAYTEHKEIIKNLSLHIPMGHTIQLIGTNGCGKSTLIDLICGLLKPQAGAIQYDDTKAHDIKSNSLKKLIGVVSQNTYLFNDTIRNNIKLGRSIEDEAIIRLSRGLGFSDIVEGEQLNLDTHISAGGGNISGGQRQKIAILRALILDPQILILDEVSTFLDSDSKESLFAYLAQNRRDKIIILVSHEATFGLKPDRMLHMDKAYF